MKTMQETMMAINVGVANADASLIKAEPTRKEARETRSVIM